MPFLITAIYKMVAERKPGTTIGTIVRNQSKGSMAIREPATIMGTVKVITIIITATTVAEAIITIRTKTSNQKACAILSISRVTTMAKVHPKVTEVLVDLPPPVHNRQVLPLKQLRLAKRLFPTRLGS